MLKYYIKATEALHRLRTDNDGVVSLEYVVVAACVIVAVIAAYKTTNLPAAIAAGFTKVTTAIGTI
jgi:Flp pilus assembly pilin Flp